MWLTDWTISSLVSHTNPVTPLSMISGIDPRRCAACQGFDEDQAERFGPIIRSEHRIGIAEKVVFFQVRHFSDIFDQRMVEERLDRRAKRARAHRRPCAAAPAHW